GQVPATGAVSSFGQYLHLSNCSTLDVYEHTDLLPNLVQTVPGFACATGAATSADGMNLYVTDSVAGFLYAFQRDRGSGMISDLAYYQDGVDGVQGLYGARDPVVSPD